MHIKTHTISYIQFKKYSKVGLRRLLPRDPDSPPLAAHERAMVDRFNSVAVSSGIIEVISGTPLRSQSRRGHVCARQRSSVRKRKNRHDRPSCNLQIQQKKVHKPDN